MKSACLVLSFILLPLLGWLRCAPCQAQEMAAYVPSETASVSAAPAAAYPTAYTFSDSSGYVHVVNLELQGHRVTKSEILWRELSLRPGDLLPRRNLQAYLKREQERLSNTNLFETVEMEVTALSADSLSVCFRLKERWYTWPMPIFELADRSFNEWVNNRGADIGRVVYGLRFRQRNFRGRNERIDLTLRLGFSRLLNLYYHIPYIDARKTLGLSFSTSYRELKTIAYATQGQKFVELNQDNTVLGRTFSMAVTASKRRAFNDVHALSLGYNYQHIADTVARLNPDYLGQGRTSLRYLSLRYQFHYQLLDNNYYPLEGKVVSAGIQKDGLWLFDDLNTVTMDADYRIFAALGKGFFYSMGGSFKTSYPNAQPYMQLRALGYGLRIPAGYDNFVIEGQHALLAKQAVKYRLLSRVFTCKPLSRMRYFSRIPLSIFLKGYADLGYVSNQLSQGEYKNPMTNTLLAGAGMGLDVVSFYSSVLRLEYSFARHNPKGGFFFYLTADF